MAKGLVQTYRLSMPLVEQHLNSLPLPHGGESQAFLWTRREFQTKDVPQVFPPVGLLVPEDTQPNLLGGEPQDCNRLVMCGLPQVYVIHLKR